MLDFLAKIVVVCCLIFIIAGIGFLSVKSVKAKLHAESFPCAKITFVPVELEFGYGKTYNSVGLDTTKQPVDSCIQDIRVLQHDDKLGLGVVVQNELYLGFCLTPFNPINQHIFVVWHPIRRVIYMPASHDNFLYCSDDGVAPFQIEHIPSPK